MHLSGDIETNTDDDDDGDVEAGAGGIDALDNEKRHGGYEGAVPGDEAVDNSTNEGGEEDADDAYESEEPNHESNMRNAWSIFRELTRWRANAREPCHKAEWKVIGRT